MPNMCQYFIAFLLPKLSVVGKLKNKQLNLNGTLCGKWTFQMQVITYCKKDLKMQKRLFTDHIKRLSIEKISTRTYND